MFVLGILELQGLGFGTPLGFWVYLLVLALPFHFGIAPQVGFLCLWFLVLGFFMFRVCLNSLSLLHPLEFLGAACASPWPSKP